MPPLDVRDEASASRLRPIAMSTFTTLCGLAPLVFIPCAGTELYRGVGAARQDVRRPGVPPQQGTVSGTNAASVN